MFYYIFIFISHRLCQRKMEFKKSKCKKKYFHYFILRYNSIGLTANMDSLFSFLHASYCKRETYLILFWHCRRWCRRRKRQSSSLIYLCFVTMLRQAKNPSAEFCSISIHVFTRIPRSAYVYKPCRNVYRNYTHAIFGSLSNTSKFWYFFWFMLL